MNNHSLWIEHDEMCLNLSQSWVVKKAFDAIKNEFQIIALHPSGYGEFLEFPSEQTRDRAYSQIKKLLNNPDTM